MFYVHEIHSLRPSGADRYEGMLRDEWVPAVAEDPETRVVWCVRSVPGSVTGFELVTLTAVADGPALERFAERVRGGDLRDKALALAGARAGMARRILAPLRFTEYAPDLANLPVLADGVEDRLYIHDFVPPRIGMQRPYEDGMEQAFLNSLKVEYSDFVMWGAFETVAGGGNVPENLMLTRIETPSAGVTLLSHGNPRESLKPGAWMYEALKLRDSWTSRLVRTVPWSPTS